jgi:rhamnose utilization protein RhaD (predicted bifunctional aldolase and dehydrogenase)
MTLPKSVRDVPSAMEFLHYSAKCGQDPLLVQAAGGNTSIKADGLLWVKASGTELADSLLKDIFVPVRLAPLLAGLERGDPACETSAEFVVRESNPSGLRPSIETTFHAVLPQRVVVHVHCVETLSWACREDAEVELRTRLKGLDWVWVPYGRPGLPLSLEIKARLSPIPSVVVLGNHGLVVAGDSVETTAKLLTEVGRRLRRPAAEARPANWARLEAVAEGSAYVPVRDAQVHGIASDPFRLQAAARGSLYPDHVIFLGPAAVVLRDGETVAAALRREPRPIAPLLLVPGAGALLPKTALPAAHALARCLADVTARLRPDDPLHYLQSADEMALLNWDAEKYRQALAKRAS